MVPGFILGEVAPKITFLTPYASVLVFFGVGRNFKNKTILT